MQLAAGTFTLLGQQVQVGSGTLFGESLQGSARAGNGLAGLTGPGAPAAVEV